MTTERRRCAVYTRKSTEEGLEQDFNSIDAQREACYAYITSQKSEGWISVRNSYDDGGFSGGNTERPALQQLMKDINAGKIDIVVVYKIDRLTRSLMDFARLAELFDNRGVTFVSVTQSFNTTTSMGRLTMNVLLSFAQFEREITAERIRDKFAASKKKGIWMGGTTPTGYDVVNRQLVPNDAAAFVKRVYELYLELGNTGKLVQYFRDNGIKSPLRTRTNGDRVGAAEFTTGALRGMLMNPIYIGKIRHEGELYDGQHPPIIPMDLWNKVQKQLSAQSLKTLRDKEFIQNPRILKGKLFDCAGHRYASGRGNKNGKKYRYYVIREMRKEYAGTVQQGLYSISAPEIENHVHDTLHKHLTSPALLASILGVDPHGDAADLQHIIANNKKLTHVGKSIDRVVIDMQQYTIEINPQKLCHYIQEVLGKKEEITPKENVFKIVVPFRLSSTMRAKTIIETREEKKDIEVLFDMREKKIRDFVRGVAWREELFQKEISLTAIAAKYKVSQAHVEKLILESFQKGLRPYFSFK